MASGAPSVGLTIRGALERHSATILVGGQSQKLLDASENWNYIFIQNPSMATESMFIDFDEDAEIDGDSMELLPGQFIYFKSPGFMTTQQININATTLGHRFVCFAN